MALPLSYSHVRASRRSDAVTHLGDGWCSHDLPFPVDVLARVRMSVGLVDESCGDVDGQTLSK